MYSDKIAKVLAHAKETGMAKTQAAFAVRIGMDANRLRNLVSGKAAKITDDEMRRMRDAFGVRLAFWHSDDAPMLLTAEELQMQQGESVQALEATTKEVLALGLDDAAAAWLQSLLWGVRRQDSKAVRSAMAAAVPGAIEYVQVPKYDVRASAGHGAQVTDESVVNHLAFSAAWVRKMGLDARSMALIEARGDSMSPTIMDGDLMLLDTRAGRVKSEGVYVINLQGALLVKRLRIRLSGIVEIVSDNAKYGCETISGDELDRLVIVGRVIWHGQKL